MSKLSIKESCQLAQISRPTLYKHINNGNISVVKDGKNTYIETSELIRIFPDIKLNDVKSNATDLHDLTTELSHKDEIIMMLKQQLNDKQKDNDFLKEQLTQVNINFTQVNNLIEDKVTKKRKKFLGIF